MHNKKKHRYYKGLTRVNWAVQMLKAGVALRYWYRNNDKITIFFTKVWQSIIFWRLKYDKYEFLKKMFIKFPYWNILTIAATKHL